MRSALGCAALGVLLLIVAGTFDAEPLYVTGSALALLGARRRRLDRAGARGARGAPRELGARSVLEEQPLEVRIRATAGRLPLPPGWIDEPLLPEPVRFRAGKRSARVRVEVTFGRRGRRRLAPPALVLRDPFGLAQRVVTGGDRRRDPRAPARAAGARHRRRRRRHARARARRADRGRRDRARRPARAPARLARLAHPLAGGGARPRADGAQADLGGRLAAARGARPARAGVAGRARQRGPRRRLADRALRAPHRLLAAAARRPARARDREGPAGVAGRARAAGAARRVDRPVAGRRAEPPRPRRAGRGAADRPPAARARPHAGRLHPRDPGSAAQPPRRVRGRRLPGLPRHARGAAAAMEAVAG